MSFYVPYDDCVELSPDSIKDWLGCNAQSFGFDGFFGCVVFPLAFNSPRMFVLGNIPGCSISGQAFEVVNALCLRGALCRGLSPAKDICEVCKSCWGDKRRSLCKFSRSTCGGTSFVAFVRSGDGLTAFESLVRQTELNFVVETLWALVVASEREAARARGVSELSAREAEVLSWIADGKTGSEIGEILGISGPTVRFHLKNVLRKLGARNTASAVSRGIMLGMLYSDPCKIPSQPGHLIEGGGEAEKTSRS